MRVLLAAALAAIIPAGAMASTLTGDMVDLVFDGNGATFEDQRVGPGTDIQVGAFAIDVDAGAEFDGFSWFSSSPATYGGGTTGITLSDLDFATGVLSGFDVSETILSDLDFSFTDTSISFTFSDIGLSPAGTILAGRFLTTDASNPDPGPGPGPDVPAVPLPAGLPLLALGLGTLGLVRRKR